MQRRMSNHKLIGGETYRIQKPARSLFIADGGNDKTTTSEESVQLNAETIYEDAFYNWHDETGNLIYSGNNLTVTPEITNKYKLQVIAKCDGFTSYDEILIHVKEFQIKSLNPNPTSNNITIEYVVKQSSSAYFSICPFNSNSSYNYVIDPNLHSTNINTSSLQTGSYYLRLIASGEGKDEMTFIKDQ